MTLQRVTWTVYNCRFIGTVIGTVCRTDDFHTQGDLVIMPDDGSGRWMMPPRFAHEIVRIEPDHAVVIGTTD